MANKYHISGKGNPEPCSATIRACPRGGEDEHYPNPEAARDAFEKSQSSETTASLKKTVKPRKIPTPSEQDLEKLREAFTFVDKDGQEKNLDENYFFNKAEKSVLIRLGDGKAVQDKHLDQFIENNAEYDGYIGRDDVPHMQAHAKVTKAVKDIRALRDTPNTLPTVESFDPDVNTVFSSSRAREKPSIMEYQMDAVQNQIGLHVFQLLKAEKEGKDTTSIKRGMLRSQAHLEAMNKEYLHSFAKALERDQAKADAEGVDIIEWRRNRWDSGSFAEARPQSYAAWSEVYPEVKDTPIKMKPLK